ncbi:MULTISPECIES: TylF/MycF/NovP-related O-methyltransferase [unclassified Novosphingobium]|uniref:TylF/MycF/NovP-related O-methyltransferase n=1 Tax=unclassified Novosphingobium TaxID=2644732 RepID=UPI0025D71B92|nr:MULTISPECIES: TylF/MycF/NovP-related O-methyltransferase [unclassified Novosphingobium]HQV02781.1 TylF/MycF/NovP-related O-methyltransferase [Novosphingobium sp.]
MSGDPDLMREAYLDLIKRTVTNYIQLGDELPLGRFHSAGFYDPKASEWTIPPIARPRTLQNVHQLELIEQQFDRITAEGITGDLIEAGVWRGGAIIFMRALLKAHGVTDRQVIAADSFAGIPLSAKFKHDTVNSWTDRWEASLPEVRAAIARFGLLDEQVELLEGYFADTLPGLAGRTLALIRLDSDSLESTETSLQYLYPLLNRGGAVMIDDWHLIGCRIAVDNYRKKNKLAGEVQVTAGNAWWIKQEERGFPGPPAGE